MQICSNCGSPVEGKFCPKCGQPVTQLSRSTTQPAPERHSTVSSEEDQPPADGPPPPSPEVHAPSPPPVQVQFQQTQVYPPQIPPTQTSDPDILLPQKMESSHFAFLIIAFLVGAFLAPVLAMPINSLAFGGGTSITSMIVTIGLVAPIAEELFKFLPMLFIALYFSRFVRSRKEGALVGAVTGLGFALMEDLIYFLAFPFADVSFGRLISLPFTHVIFSAWWGIAIYTIIAGKRTYKDPQLAQQSPAFLFVILAIGNHMAWNMLLVLFSLSTTIDNTILLAIIAICVVGIPSVFLLRYALGGSFGISKRVINALRVLGIVAQPAAPQYYGPPPPYQSPAHSPWARSQQVEWEVPTQAPTQQQQATYQPTQQAPFQSQSQNRCPRCGTALVWSVQYGRMWCGYCRSFV